MPKSKYNKSSTGSAIRNIHACHPIMRKGGVHEKSKGAKRAKAKKEVRQKVKEWSNSLRSDFECSLLNII